MEVVIDFSNENLLAMVVIDYYDHVYWMKNKGYVDVQTLNDNNLVRNDDLVHVPMTYNDGDSPDLKTCDDDDNLFPDNHVDLFHDNLDKMMIEFVMMVI